MLYCKSAKVMGDKISPLLLRSSLSEAVSNKEDCSGWAFATCLPPICTSQPHVCDADQMQINCQADKQPQRRSFTTSEGQGSLYLSSNTPHVPFLGAPDCLLQWVAPL